jgi:ribose transport system permease protein
MFPNPVADNTTNVDSPPQASAPVPPQRADQPRSPQAEFGRRVAGALAPRNISAIYVFAAIFVIFSLWVPHTFLAGTTWKTLLDSQAETALLAVGLVIAVAAGSFDLAIGTELGFGSIVVAWLLVNHGVPVVPAIVLTVLVGALIGLINGLLVVRARIDSFIATLGMSSVLLALIAWLSNSEQILGLSNGFQGIANDQIFGITLPVYLMLALAFVVWYVLERTPLGRRVYATGGNTDAARLAGVRTSLVVIGALVACGAIAAASGILVSAELGAGDPTIGPAYLLPAFSAVFLGSTQFKGGRFNVWGTVLAVYELATGVKGLQLAGAPVWIPDLFNGAALLLAVGLARYQGAAHRTGAIQRLLRMRGPSTPTHAEDRIPA